MAIRNKVWLDMSKSVSDLANCLNELQSADIENAPSSGQHDFYHSGSLSVYDGEARKAIEF
jgi:aminoglycoside phosphotransferase (APT) family kinase protein